MIMNCKTNVEKSNELACVCVCVVLCVSNEWREVKQAFFLPDLRVLYFSVTVESCDAITTLTNVPESTWSS